MALKPDNPTNLDICKYQFFMFWKSLQVVPKGFLGGHAWRLNFIGGLWPKAQNLVLFEFFFFFFFVCFNQPFVFHFHSLSSQLFGQMLM